MKLKPLLKIILAGLVLANNPLEMFAQLAVSAQLYPRLEYRDGYRLPGSANTDAAFFVSQRSRLNIDFKNEKLKVFISPQDVRVWGAEKQLADDPGFGLHEAWGQLALGGNFSIKAGRQELVYDGHRLLGNVDWVQQARSHDALLLKLENEGLKVDLGGAFNQSGENIFGTNYRSDNYKALGFLHAGKNAGKFSWNAIVLSDAFEKADTNRDLAWRHTLGALLGYKTGRLSLEGSAYWQGGKTKGNQDIAAYLFHITTTYEFNKLSLAAGLDVVSGDDSNDPDYQAFNTLFGTNHKFYGLMDYFLDVPADTDGGGLQDYYLNLNVNTSSKSSLKFSYHQFLLAKDVADQLKPGEVLPRNLGGELDAVFEYKIAPYAKLNTGLSFYFTNSTTQQIKGGAADKTNTWAWMMLILTPELFNSGTGNKG